MWGVILWRRSSGILLLSRINSTRYWGVILSECSVLRSTYAWKWSRIRVENIWHCLCPPSDLVGDKKWGQIVRFESRDIAPSLPPWLEANWWASSITLWSGYINVLKSSVSISEKTSWRSAERSWGIPPPLSTGSAVVIVQEVLEIVLFSSSGLSKNL